MSCGTISQSAEKKLKSSNSKVVLSRQEWSRRLWPLVAGTVSTPHGVIEGDGGRCGVGVVRARSIHSTYVLDAPGGDADADALAECLVKSQAMRTELQQARQSLFP